jgi:hypothetical protein
MKNIHQWMINFIHKVNFNNVTNFIHPKDSPISLCVCAPNSIFLTNIIHLGETCYLVVRFTFTYVFYFIHFPQISFVGPCFTHRDSDYRIGSNFWKFYLTRTSFTLREPVSLVKVFRLFRSKLFFFGCSECGHSK